ncbi:hypothetical protein GCM10010377_06830 [Streptomyces viridiviolaceus]|nr:hypothetical protein GCM10010377_06830 [Streptomyces viridiviolaceus]
MPGHALSVCRVVLMGGCGFVVVGVQLPAPLRGVQEGGRARVPFSVGVRRGAFTASLCLVGSVGGVTFTAPARGTGQLRYPQVAWG